MLHKSDLGKWSEHFETYWNDGIITKQDSVGGGGGYSSALNKLKNFLLLREKVPAESLFERADEWWETNSSPRFLWLHLMEPHQPYKPGLTLGREHGLLRTYASLVGMVKYENYINDHQRFRQSLKRLHYQTVKRLDSFLTPWLKKYQDEATVIVTGDHGEEFDHGIVEHARLYDETVRVPIFTNRRDLFPAIGTVRQIDLSPSILDHIGVSRPTEWIGRVWREEMLPQPMLASTPKLRKTYTGIRSGEWKIIRTHDWDGGGVESEAYNLSDDPKEENLLPEGDAPDALVKDLEEFISRNSVQEALNEEMTTEFDEEVTSRLRNLGYVE